MGLPVAGARHLCGLVDTNQSGADGADYMGSTEGEWWQGKAMGRGSEQAGVASCFPGSELQVRSRADVAREDATTDGCNSGKLIVSERHQGGVVHDGN